jgi:hypothetical protein
MSKHTLYPPRAEENPWRLDTWMNTAEWKEVSRWYPFSLRSLMPDGRWYEAGRFGSRDSAYGTMRTLAAADGRRLFVIVQCTLIGKDGREKAVVFFPGSEQTVLAERRRRLVQAGDWSMVDEPQMSQSDREQDLRQIIEALLEIATPGNVKASLWSRYQELAQE